MSDVTLFPRSIYMEIESLRLIIINNPKYKNSQKNSGKKKKKEKKKKWRCSLSKTRLRRRRSHRDCRRPRSQYDPGRVRPLFLFLGFFFSFSDEHIFSVVVVFFCCCRVSGFFFFLSCLMNTYFVLLCFLF